MNLGLISGDSHSFSHINKQDLGMGCVGFFSSEQHGSAVNNTLVQMYNCTHVQRSYWLFDSCK